MFLTISDSVLEHMQPDAEQNTGPLYGRVLDNGDVVQVLGLDESSGTYLGQWVFSPQLVLPESLAQSMPPEGKIVLLVRNEPQPEINAYCVRDTQVHPVESDIIRPHADFGSRLRGLFEVDHLATACIAIIGIGTGGAMAATMLARSGVGHIRLVDFDRLEVHNIARHVCGLSDIGRYKTHALRDMLLDISPILQVTTYEVDILKQPEVLEDIVDGCDVVIAATDSEQSKLAINAVCWRRGIPAVYGAAYNRAFGGDIFRAIPPDGACYNCFEAVVTEYFGPPPAATDDFSLGYADPSRMADLIAEPGLGLDAGMIAMIMTRVALMTVLRNTQTTLTDFPSNWVLFGNRAEWIFEKPLESLFIDVPRQQDCPICNYQEYVGQLDMTPEEAEEAAQSLVSELPKDSPLQRRD